MDVHPLSPDVGPLLVVYDAEPAGSGGTTQSAFCTWCRGWLENQPLLVPLRFTPAGGGEAQARLGVLGAGAELVVVADDGRAWTGAKAFVMCLWATAAHRQLSYALRLPLVRTGAQAFFYSLTENHVILDRLLQRGPAPAAAS